MARPAWRVELDDADTTALIVPRGSGEALGAKTDAWRLRDMAWMLHA